MPFAGKSRSDSEEGASVEQLVEANPNIEARDLFYGVGGAKLAPRADAAYRFLDRDESGASTNIEVEDANGRKWDAKLGVEARPRSPPRACSGRSASINPPSTT